jgi:hypothetical protein
VTVSSKNDSGSTRLKTVEVVVGEGAQAKTYTQDLGFRPECEELSANPPPGCKRESTIAIDPIDTDHVVIRVADIAGPDNPITSRVRIDEVSINGEANTPPVDRQKIPTACVTDRVQIGTEGASPASVPVPVRIQGTLGDLLDGKPVPIAGCQRISLSAGWHRLDTGVSGPIDQVQLLTTELADQTLQTRSNPGPVIGISAQSATRIQASTTNQQKGTVLLFEQSWDPGWSATVNGRPIGRAKDFDAVNGWVIDDTGRLQIELQYTPQRLFGLSLAVTAVGVAVCVLLIAHKPRRRQRRSRA